MKNTPLLLTFLLFTINMLAQTPRIALVKPNGTTTIHSTLQEAYNAASDDDYIYLPGGYMGSIALHKKVNIIGAGCNIDSSSVTGVTKMHDIVIYQGASGGSIEGIYVFNNYPIRFENYNGASGTGFTIKKCFLGGGIHSNIPWTELVILNNYIGLNGSNSVSGSISNSIFKNNIIIGQNNVSYSTLTNNIIYPAGQPNYSIFKNNIFSEGMTASGNTSYSVFYNNVNCNLGGSPNGNEVYENINEAWIDIFENPGTCSGTPQSCIYDVHNNYHVKSTSACHNSGTDGTDRGIYGGTSPWVEGSVPSNPHIYFKHVAEETNASGQLQIQFKVRTGN